MRRGLPVLVFLFATLIAFAQTTKVRGRVTDSADGQGVPFAAVLFEGTEVGVSADMDGAFSLTTRDMNLSRLLVQQLGYEPVTVDVKPGSFNDIVVTLHQQSNQLNAVTVKADNRKVKRLLARIDSCRARNNPEMRDGYSCDVYSKMELDLTHPQEQLRGKALRKQWGFIFDYVDTSDVSGTPYLPVMINESFAKRYHSSDPDVSREVITANRLSGADPSGNLLAQFTGSMHLKNNFYDQFLNVFNVELPSPINTAGLLYYNYFIIDSLKLDGRKTYLVRYHPKEGISSPAFDGEMLVDAKEYALRRITAKMKRGQNINWVRDMVLEASYQRMPDSTWFFQSDRFYADFSLSTRDSSQMLSFIGNRSLEFSNPVFGATEVDRGSSVTMVESDASRKDDAFWDSARPYALSAKEQNIYNMVERIKDTPLYRTWYDVVETVINGYWDVGKIGFGNILKFVSYNPLEGFKPRFGIRTSPEWSKTDRVGGYIAFGFRDRQPKAGIMYEHMFSKSPTSKLTLDIHYDTIQLGRGKADGNTGALITDGNILSSIFGAGKTQKLCPVGELNINYDHEFNANVNSVFNLTYREFYANSFVPAVTPDGNVMLSVPTLNARALLRFSRDETINRGHFIKKYLDTKKPVWVVELNAGVTSLNRWQVIGAGQLLASSRLYLRPELTLKWDLRVPPAGITGIYFNAGTILGKVPYTMLHIHEGNGTFLLDPSAFSTMNFFEFASDTWATLMIDHNFHGFFLGKIPWVKKLQLREAVVVKATWGMLSRRNDGTRGADSQAILLFPEGMKAFDNVPYVEAGFAITNIFRLLRVDFLWRCTHRNDARENPRNFVVNLGLEIKF